MGWFRSSKVTSFFLFQLLLCYICYNTYLLSPAFSFVNLQKIIRDFNITGKWATSHIHVQDVPVFSAYTSYPSICIHLRSRRPRTPSPRKSAINIICPNASTRQGDIKKGKKNSYPGDQKGNPIQGQLSQKKDKGDGPASSSPCSSGDKTMLLVLVVHGTLHNYVPYTRGVHKVRLSHLPQRFIIKRLRRLTLNSQNVHR